MLDIIHVFRIYTCDRSNSMVRITIGITMRITLAAQSQDFTIDLTCVIKMLYVFNQFTLCSVYFHIHKLRILCRKKRTVLLDLLRRLLNIHSYGGITELSAASHIELVISKTEPFLLRLG